MTNSGDKRTSRIIDSIPPIVIEYEYSYDFNSSSAAAVSLTASKDARSTRFNGEVILGILVGSSLSIRAASDDDSEVYSCVSCTDAECVTVPTTCTETKNCIKHNQNCFLFNVSVVWIELVMYVVLYILLNV